MSTALTKPIVLKLAQKLYHLKLYICGLHIIPFNGSPGTYRGFWRRPFVTQVLFNRSLTAYLLLANPIAELYYELLFFFVSLVNFSCRYINIYKNNIIIFSNIQNHLNKHNDFHNHFNTGRYIMIFIIISINMMILHNHLNNHNDFS